MTAAPWCGRPLSDDRDGWYARAMAFKEDAEEAERRVEIAESVAQMAAHDRDEALENFALAEQEIKRLREALMTASGQLGVLSTVLSGSNRPTHAARAWEWSKEARAIAGEG